MGDCNVLLSLTLLRQNVLFCNIKSPAAGCKSTLVARLSYHCHILKSCEHNPGDHKQIMFVQYNYNRLLGHTNFLKSPPNLQAEQKSHCGMITILAQATAGKYDVKLKYPKNMFLFTVFLLNFSHPHIKITSSTQINNRFWSLFYCDVYTSVSGIPHINKLGCNVHWTLLTNRHLVGQD